MVPVSAAVILTLLFGGIYATQDHAAFPATVSNSVTTQAQTGVAATTSPLQSTSETLSVASTTTTQMTTASATSAVTTSPTASSSSTAGTPVTTTTSGATASTTSASSSTTSQSISTVTGSATTTVSTTTSSSSAAGGAGPAAVNLGTAGNYVILSKSGISTTGTTSITGNLGVSPISSTAVTGFGLVMDSSGQFSTSSLVSGKVYASNYAVPTPTAMTSAVSDMQTAYTDAAGRTNPTATELGAGNISGMTLTPGLYKWGTGVTISTGVTLDCQGNPNAVFIFQIAQTLTVGSGAIITLSGGCQASNIFWQVGGQTTLGTTSSFQGIILCQTAIVMNTGATLTGRALAQTAVTLSANAVTSP